VSPAQGNKAKRKRSPEAKDRQCSAVASVAYKLRGEKEKEVTNTTMPTIRLIDLVA
jgi:hypothetical protein